MEQEFKPHGEPGETNRVRVGTVAQERMSDSNRIYFIERAQEERAAAEAAETSEGRKTHLQLAEHYEELATAIGLQEKLGLHG